MSDGWITMEIEWHYNRVYVKINRILTECENKNIPTHFSDNLYLDIDRTNAFL